MKSLATSPPGKFPIPNTDNNMLGKEIDYSLSPQLANFRPGPKSLLNEAENGRQYSTDMSHTDKLYSADNIREINNKNIDGKYKEDNLQHHDSNESVINKTKEEEAFIKQLMSMNFSREVIHYLIGTIISFGGK